MRLAGGAKGGVKACSESWGRVRRVGARGGGKGGGRSKASQACGGGGEGCGEEVRRRARGG